MVEGILGKQEYSTELMGRSVLTAPEGLLFQVKQICKPFFPDYAKSGIIAAMETYLLRRLNRNQVERSGGSVRSAAILGRR